MRNIILIFTLLSASFLGAWQYSFINKSDKNLILKIKALGIDKYAYQIIPRDSSVEQIWKGLEVGLCLGSIQWTEWIGTEPEYKMLTQKLGDFDKKYLKDYSWNDLDITMPDNKALRGLKSCKNMSLVISDSGNKNPLSKRAILKAQVQ
jgi:hypothetical protein